MHRTARAALITLVTLLLVFGAVMLYSTTYAAHAEKMLTRQLQWIVLGSLAALIARAVPYRDWGRYSTVLLVLVSLSLAYLALASILYRKPFELRTLVEHLPLVGGPTKGSFRWLRLWRFGLLPSDPPKSVLVSIQPSEFAKPALILFLASYFGRHARHVHEWRRGFAIPILRSGVVIGLILLGGSLSATAITGCVVLSLLFIAGVRLRYLCLTVALGLILVATVLAISPERRSRITSFRHPEREQASSGYQLHASKLALGSGSWAGLGFTKSRMKQQYLPEAHTDFIVSIVGEELGFIAVVSLVLAYLALVGVGYWIAAKASDREGTLIGAGVATSLAVHAFVNISVVSGFGPTTGVTAPFISSGGSSMIASLIGVGLLLNVSRRSEEETGRLGVEGRPPTGPGVRAAGRPWGESGTADTAGVEEQPQQNGNA